MNAVLPPKGHYDYCILLLCTHFHFPNSFLVNYNFVCSFKYLYIFYNFLPLGYISEENTVLVIYFVGWLLVYC